MQLTEQIAKQFRDVYFGGNWTSVNLRDTLKDVTWRQAVTQVQSFNTIATLVFHTHYYVAAVLKVLQGGPLDAKDAYSFDHPPIGSAADWDRLLDTVWQDVAAFADAVAALPEHLLWADFSDPKYGSYYRNITGVIEHTHYHLGQMVLIKKLLGNGPEAAEPMESLIRNHEALIDYVRTLTDDQLTLEPAGKWTAGQQLAHVHLCLHPISQALVSRDYIVQKFGSIGRTPWSSDEVLQRYRQALEGGGKAPDRFVPGPVQAAERENLIHELSALLQTLRQQWAGYSDEDRETLVLPHPLLGMMTLRELVDLMAYHAVHHQRQTEHNLAQPAGA